MGHPTIGILGGMGPAATGEFILELTRATRASVDQDHYHSITLSVPSVPDRTTAILAGDDGPLAPIREGLEALAGWGADLLAVPCNTAHFFIDQFRSELAVPLVHIVDATLDAAESRSPEGAWLTATTGTVATGLYQEAAERRGFPLHRPSGSQQERIMGVVGLVKSGEMEAAGDAYRLILEELFAERAIPALTACTELPLAFDASGLDGACAVSSLRALAEATVRAAGEWTPPRP